MNEEDDYYDDDMGVSDFPDPRSLSLPLQFVCLDQAPSASMGPKAWLV